MKQTCCRRQRLALVLLKQSGVSDKMDPVSGPYAPHFTPQRLAVTPFALRESYRTPNTHFDPGAPLGGEGNQAFIDDVVHIIQMSGHLDPGDGDFIDISPGARGNAAPGDYEDAGHVLNPATGGGTGYRTLSLRPSPGGPQSITGGVFRSRSRSRLA